MVLVPAWPVQEEPDRFRHLLDDVFERCISSNVCNSMEASGRNRTLLIRLIALSHLII